MEKQRTQRHIASRAALLAALCLLLSILAGCVSRGAEQTQEHIPVADGAEAAQTLLSGMQSGCLAIGYDAVQQKWILPDVQKPPRVSGGALDRRFKHERAYVGPEGTAGRLVIPSVGINVAVNLPGEDAQATADAPDSACWMEYAFDLNPVIGDHVNQDFGALLRVQSGDECMIVKDGIPYRYVCTAVRHGQNTEEDVIDENGDSIFRRGEDKLCMYTCENGWRYVFIAEWQCLSETPLHQTAVILMTE